MNSACDSTARTKKPVWSSDNRGEVLGNSPGSDLPLVRVALDVIPINLTSYYGTAWLLLVYFLAHTPRVWRAG